MDRLRSAVSDFYLKRKREFMMVVLLLLLFVYNIFAYLSGDKYNLFAIIFGPRGVPVPTEQAETETASLSQSVKEGQELDKAAQNLVQTPPPETPAPPPASPVEKAEQSPAGQTQTGSLPQNVPAVTPVAVNSVYTDLGRDYFYRDDPFKPVVALVKARPRPTDGFKFPVVHPVKEGPCGSVLQAAYSETSFGWPSEKPGEGSGASGLPPLPGTGGEGDVPGKGASFSSGGLKLTGVIFDSQPVALIRFNGKDVNVRIHERIGSCKVLVITKNQVVLAEPNGKQRRLFL